ncbi:hypothetical protein NPIL_106101 [Nephila pilipes]|uniref:Uncharacterized protein n=1 Tax=Nephila pilipes TaxID=299642 RepID=A0A8X6UQC1_NEPPI|nr:hypothetical protein NPIL_106101 [Nephila pilipes]
MIEKGTEESSQACDLPPLDMSFASHLEEGLSANSGTKGIKKWERMGLNGWSRAMLSQPCAFSRLLRVFLPRSFRTPHLASLPHPISPSPTNSPI